MGPHVCGVLKHPDNRSVCDSSAHLRWTSETEHVLVIIIITLNAFSRSLRLLFQLKLVLPLKSVPLQYSLI